jgi:hypothetical protein
VTKDQLVARIEALLPQASRVAQGYEDPPAEQVLAGALTIMGAIYGNSGPQVASLLKRRDEVAKWVDSARSQAIGSAVHGVLQNAHEEIMAGMLGSFERRIASDVLSDLVQLAREALKDQSEGAKNVAAVLAAAAYEDTIRRIAREHAGIIGLDKLETVIRGLKDAGLLVAPQLGLALGYLNFRNRALHANWDQIERATVESALGFIEQLLLKHFG